MRVGRLVAVVSVLAGCASPDFTAPASAPPAPVEESFDLLVSQAVAGGGGAGGVGNRNCVRIVSEDPTRMDVTATATWTPEGPHAQLLRLGFKNNVRDGEHVKLEGTSPLTSEVEGVNLTGEDYWFVYVGPVEGPRAALQQSVRLTLRVATTESEVRFDPASCVFP